jgi:hypothetical protein
MSFWANVFLGKCCLGKCLLGKCLSGQMSFWANVVWANVTMGKRRMGKCLWANALGIVRTYKSYQSFYLITLVQCPCYRE